MSIQTELTRITNAKAAIKTAIEGKGVTVPDGTMLDGMAALIDAIEAGGGDTSAEDGLIERSITAYSNSRVTKIGNNAFYQYDTLTKADFPAVTSIGNYAFYDCTKLKTENFPVATSIGNYAFYSCSSLTEADFPAVTSIGNYAFRGCGAMVSAYFPAATSIGSNAFYQCDTLTKADFPVATSIGNYAFYSCSSLKELILRSETMCNLSNTNALTNTPIKSGTGYIYVPSALLESYKAATNWSTYSANFRAIEDYGV